MAKEQVIFTDGNELTLLLKGKVGRDPYNIHAENVQRISFGYTCDGFWNKLKHRNVRTITVICKGIGTVQFDETAHKQFFEGYLTDLREYCKSNHVTFYDFPENK